MTSKFKVFNFSLILGLIFLLSPSFGQNQALAQTTPAATNSGAGFNSSYNWAGYVASGSNFTSVTASWTVPQISASTNLTGDATWVGIGGVGIRDLIQAGTQALTNANGSSLSYEAWYETLPGYSQTMNMTISAGDSITASLTQQSPNIWNISLHDNTNGQNFQTTINYVSSLSSAEWIQEMPSAGNGRFIPLDNFGTVQFTNASAVENGQTVNIAQAGGQQLTMQNFSQQELATPSQLGPDGASFSVTRTSATATSLSGLPSGRQGISGFGGFTRRRQRLQSYIIQQPGGFFRFRVRMFSRD